jgi:hypothetical protein
MKLYEIALPLYHNSNTADYHNAHNLFSDRVIGAVGGLTKLPVAEGSWVDEGTLYREPMQCYRIATDDPEIWDGIVALAFRLFPDQIAIYWSSIGDATITYRNVTDKTPDLSTARMGV